MVNATQIVKKNFSRPPAGLLTLTALTILNIQLNVIPFVRGNITKKLIAKGIYCEGDLLRRGLITKGITNERDH